jgi:hypothetical protein
MKNGVAKMRLEVLVTLMVMGHTLARVAAYKVFGYEPDILSAVDHAITDGIDVISISMNSKFPREFIGSSFAIGTFNAIVNGIIYLFPNPTYGT